MPHMQNMHATVVDRENESITPAPPAKDQLPEHIPGAQALPGPRTSLGKVSQRLDRGLHRFEPMLGRLRRVHRNPTCGLVNVPLRAGLDDDLHLHFAERTRCFCRSRREPRCGIRSFSIRKSLQGKALAAR